MTADEASGGDWDFFISYTQSDRAWAEWIAWILEEDGYRVLIQAWDFVPGTNWTLRIQEGIRGATRTIVVLSDRYLESVFNSAEWQAAWASDPLGVHRKLLIVRVADSDRPGLLGDVVGVDLFGRTEDDAKARLQQMITSATTGRGKPSAAPGFPGTAHPVQFPAAPPQVWNVPARNSHFTGRTHDLDSLARELTTKSSVSVVSIRGIAGIGKSELAIEYAFSHATTYEVVWWIAAGNPALISGQLAMLASQLGLDPPPNRPNALQDQVQERLRRLSG